MLSRNIKDHKDIGLNADWCISTYHLGGNFYIFDIENQDNNGEWIHELCTVIGDPCHEESYTVYHTGTFAECIDKYNSIAGKE